MFPSISSHGKNFTCSLYLKIALVQECHGLNTHYFITMFVISHQKVLK